MLWQKTYIANQRGKNTEVYRDDVGAVVSFGPVYYHETTAGGLLEILRSGGFLMFMTSTRLTLHELTLRASICLESFAGD